MNSDRHRSLLKARQYDAVTNLTRFYPEHRYHTHRHPCTGCTERKDILHQYDEISILLLLGICQAGKLQYCIFYLGEGVEFVA